MDNYIFSINNNFCRISLFHKDDYIKINGFSNNYIGWGCEDIDFLLRCYFSNIKIKKYNFIWQTLDKQKTKNEFKDLYSTNFYQRNLSILKSINDKKIDFMKDGYNTIDYHIDSTKRISKNTFFFNIHNKIKEYIMSNDLYLT